MSQGGDLIKQYGWIVVLAAVLIGFWLSMPMTTGTGSDSVSIARQGGQDTEQSLRSLDPVDNPQGAPGGAVGEAGAGGASPAPGAPAAPGSSLYQPPGGAAGEPASGEVAAAGGIAGGAAAASASAAGKTTLAEAMAKVAQGGKAPDHGWGDKEVRTGFSKPKANFGQVGLTRSGSAGASSAQLTVVEKAFGTGGNPGLDPGAAGFGAAQGKASALKASVERSRGMSELSKLKKQDLSALSGGAERAAGFGRDVFDASSANRRSLRDVAREGSAAAAGISGDGVPVNLKATDPGAALTKEFEPPPVDGAGEVQDSENKEYMKQKIMMMLLSTAISGILGPTMSAVGTSVTGALGFGMPSPGAGNVVDGAGVK